MSVLGWEKQVRVKQLLSAGLLHNAMHAVPFKSYAKSTYGNGANSPFM